MYFGIESFRLLDLLLLLNLNDHRHASTTEVEKQISKIQVDNSCEVIPIESLRIVHKQKRNENANKYSNQ